MKKTYNVSVKLLSAMHINGGANVNGTRISLRSEGKAYIPASLFKGMVRENFTKLWQMLPDSATEKCTGRDSIENGLCKCTVCSMFGKAGFQRSRIYFDHLESSQKLNYQLRANVSIDRDLRKAVDQALVFTEVVERYCNSYENEDKQDTVFDGEITVYYPPEIAPENQKKIEAVLIQSIKMINYIGLGKSRGLGFVKTEVKRPKGGWLCEI